MGSSTIVRYFASQEFRVTPATVGFEPTTFGILALENTGKHLLHDLTVSMRAFYSQKFFQLTTKWHRLYTNLHTIHIQWIKIFVGNIKGEIFSCKLWHSES